MQQNDHHDQHGHHDDHDHHDHHDAHASIANWKQPVIATAIALVATIGILVLLTQIVTDTPKPAKDDDAAVLARLKPAGELMIASAAGPKGQLTGEQVFNQTCKTCHEAGLAGSPKVGDKKAWGKVIAQGQKTAVEHAINGIRAMPPKGGNPDYENVEVERAVVFMANQAGANWKAAPPSAAQTAATSPGAPISTATAAPASASAAGSAAPAASTIAAASATAGPAASATASAAAAAKPDGKKVYDTTCMVCHATGAAGAPKFGDKAAWAPRIKTGIDALHATALKGKGAMPAKGGNTALSDADVTAAVDYMVAAGK
ncbi:MAG TPA: c-type cytochrome [Casimicrobiaceae bacterium]|nr:c-type cytochrome [Casimicrobiaceae bacterium]